MTEHFKDKLAADANELRTGLAAFLGQLTHANPHAVHIAEALGAFCSGANPAVQWERENGGGTTVKDQSLLDLNIREMQRGRWWSEERGCYIDPSTGEPIDLEEGSDD